MKTRSLFGWHKAPESTEEGKDKMKANVKGFGLVLTTLTVASLMLVLAVLVLTETPVMANPGTTYYVDDNTGNDSRTPAEAQVLGTPWKTISHAVATVPAGVLGDPNIINVATGLYNTKDNGEAFPITFTNAHVKLVGAGAGTTTVDGEGTVDIFNIAATGITIEGFTIRNATDDGVEANIGGFTIQDNVFTGVDYGVYLEISRTLAANYIVSDVAVLDNTFTVTDTGFEVDIVLDGNDGAYTVVVSNFNVLSNTFTVLISDTDNNGVNFYDLWVTDINGGQITVGDITISANTFYSGYDGIDIFEGTDYGGFEYITDTLITVGDIIITDNVLRNQADTGIEVEFYEAGNWYGTTAGNFGDLVIDDNDIQNTGEDGIEIPRHTYADYFYNTASLTLGDVHVEGNEVLDGGDDGIEWWEEDADDLRNNTSVTAGQVSIISNTLDVAHMGIYGGYEEFGYDLYDTAAVTAGDLRIENNAINAAYEGIHLEYDDIAYDVHSNTVTTLGDVYIASNVISSTNEAIHVYYAPAYKYTGEVATDMEDNAQLLMGNLYIQDNDLRSSEEDGIEIYYGDTYVCEYMYDDSYAKLPDYVITGNTINAGDDGIYLYTNGNPWGMFDNSICDFGGALIDDNTFNDQGVGMSDGIYFDYEDVCYADDGGGCFDYSTTTIGDVTIINNEFYDLVDEAVFIWYDDIGYELHDEALLQVGNLVIATNVISGADYGIDVAYYYIVSYDDSTVTMGALDITSNDISNVTTDGIYVGYWLSATVNSTQTISRTLIMSNTLYGSGDDIYHGIHVSYDDGDSDVGATITLGEPIIISNTIELWTYGIYLEDVNEEVGGATVSYNLIRDNGDGIYLEGSDYITITCNDILSNTASVASGIHLDSVSGEDTVIHNNNIVGNSASGGYGVYFNTVAGTIDAENNWWGAIDGPDDDAAVINGSGDTISSGVDADPWLANRSVCTPQNALNVNLAGSGTGTVTSALVGVNCGTDCTEVYDKDTVVTLTATPDVGSVFVGWSGDADCSDGQVTMDVEKTCTATFGLFVPVGGIAVPVNRLGLLAPWLGLVALAGLAALGVVMARRRRG